MCLKDKTFEYKIGHYVRKTIGRRLGDNMQATLQHYHPGGGALFAARRLEFESYPNSEAECDSNLPKDPRRWTRDNVQQWLDEMATVHNLPNMDDHRSRFLMNGKALCLMSQSMFVHRVPLGGKLLFRDFQLRLSAAMHNYP